jgi:hypothetical protein
MVDLLWFFIEEIPLRFFPYDSLVIGGCECLDIVLMQAKLNILLVPMSLPNEYLRMANDLHLSAALTLGLTL